MPDYPWHRYSQNYSYMGVFVGATYAQTAYVQFYSTGRRRVALKDLPVEHMVLRLSLSTCI